MARITKKPEERRQEIVSACRDLFLKQGYENTTIQDVMGKLQIAKGTTYHYFKSKEELLGAVVEDLGSDYIRAVEEKLRGCPGNAMEKMVRLISSGRLTSSSNLLEAIHRAGNGELHARLLGTTVNRLAPLYAGVIEQGCREGIFQVEHPLECAEILLAGIQFVTDVGCYPWSQEELERRMRAIPRVIEAQLQAARGSFAFLFEGNSV